MEIKKGNSFYFGSFIGLVLFFGPTIPIDKSPTLENVSPRVKDFETEMESDFNLVRFRGVSVTKFASSQFAFILEMLTKEKRPDYQDQKNALSLLQSFLKENVKKNEEKYLTSLPLSEKLAYYTTVFRIGERLNAIIKTEKEFEREAKKAVLVPAETEKVQAIVPQVVHAPSISSKIRTESEPVRAKAPEIASEKLIHVEHSPLITLVKPIEIPETKAVEEAKVSVPIQLNLAGNTPVLAPNKTEEELSDQLFIDAIMNAKNFQEFLTNLQRLAYPSSDRKNYLKSNSFFEDKANAKISWKNYTNVWLKRIKSEPVRLGLIPLIGHEGKKFKGNLLTKEYMKRYLFDPTKFNDDVKDHLVNLVAKASEKALAKPTYKQIVFSLLADLFNRLKGTKEKK